MASEATSSKQNRKFCILRDDDQTCVEPSCQKAIDEVTRALVENGHRHLDYTDDDNDERLREADCVLVFVTTSHWEDVFTRDVQGCELLKPKPLMIPVYHHLNERDEQRLCDSESPLNRLNLTESIKGYDGYWIQKIVKSFKCL